MEAIMPRSKRIKLVKGEDGNVKSGASTSEGSISHTQDQRTNMTLSSSTSSPVCFLNNYVLEQIFSYLDSNSIKACRTVCKQWDEEASRKLGDTSWFKVTLGSHSDSDYSEAEKYHQLRREARMKGIDNLIKCLQNLSSSYLFKNFEVDLEWILDTKVQMVLEKFGSNLKRITIRDQYKYKKDEIGDYLERMDIIWRIVTEWCKKLSTFKMESKRKTKGLHFSKQTKWTEPIKIREISVIGVLTEFQSRFWVHLIKSCPSLNKLRISCVPLRRWDEGPNEKVSICESFFQQISELPDITRKLHEFSWNKTFPHRQTKYRRGTFCNILKYVCAMEFSTGLKHFGFGPSSDSPPPNLPYLHGALKKLDDCAVENIVFDGDYDREKVNQEDNANENEDLYLLPFNLIPEMSSVKSITSYSDLNYGLGRLKFIHKFPNLQKFYTWQDVRNLDEWKYLATLTHYNLKTMNLKDFVKTRTPLNYIAEAFPNVIYLQLEAGWPTKTNNQNWCFYPIKNDITIFDAVSNAAKFTSLEELTVSLSEEYKPKEICEALGIVKDFPKLKRLTFEADSKKHRYKLPFMSIKRGLSQLSNLTCSVYLVGFKVTNFETIQMQKYCEENRIRAKFIPRINTIYQKCQSEPYMHPVLL